MVKDFRGITAALFIPRSLTTALVPVNGHKKSIVMTTHKQHPAAIALHISFVFHHDASHGWLEVPSSLLEELGIAGQISQFSYQNEDNVYLEEDQDAGIFIRAYLQRLGKPSHDLSAFEYTESWDGDSSPIRRYRRYHR